MLTSVNSVFSDGWGNPVTVTVPAAYLRLAQTHLFESAVIWMESDFRTPSTITDAQKDALDNAVAEITAALEEDEDG